MKTLALAAVLAVGGLGVVGQANAAATIIINNINAPGVGFNDNTAAAPVGGNTGTTVGQQRLIAFTYAANLWGQTLTSSQPIIINAQFSALTCTPTSAVLGSAGATSIFANFTNAPKANTWYSYALANKISGVYQGVPNAAQINANFNANLGSPTGGNTNGVPTVPTTGCLTGTSFYLGLDGNHGTNTDFVEVLLHEMGHGLGFQTFTNGSTGAFNGTAPNNYPSIWDHYLLGTVTGKLWKDMTAAERVASAISVDKLVWSGPAVTSVIPSVLTQGSASATFSGPAVGASIGTVFVGEADVGPPVTRPGVFGEVMPVTEQTAGAGEGCEALNANNARAVSGKIALISRGTCTFAIKVKNAQNAGARAVIIADNAAATGTVPAGISVGDPTVTITSVRIFQADGVILRNALKTRSRTSSGVFATIGLIGTQYAGADPSGRALMYAPNPFQSGSSVSHFDTTMTRNQLMEPAINGNLTQSVVPPLDMTYILLQEIGW